MTASRGAPWEAPPGPREEPFPLVLSSCQQGPRKEAEQASACSSCDSPQACGFQHPVGSLVQMLQLRPGRGAATGSALSLPGGSRGFQGQQRILRPAGEQGGRQGGCPGTQLPPAITPALPLPPAAAVAPACLPRRCRPHPTPCHWLPLGHTLMEQGVPRLFTLGHVLPSHALPCGTGLGSLPAGLSDPCHEQLRSAVSGCR